MGQIELSAAGSMVGDRIRKHSILFCLVFISFAASTKLHADGVDGNKGVLGSEAFFAGVEYLRGVGADQSFEMAEKKFRESADAGHAGGQYFLGLAYLYGHGVHADESKAWDWIAKAAKAGQLEAIRMMARSPENGGDEEWAVRSAGAGHGGALYELALSYFSAAQGDKRHKGIDLLKEAAYRGHPGAQNMLGDLYARRSTKPGFSEIDYYHAYIWYTLASQNGHQTAGRMRDEMAEELAFERREKAHGVAETIQLNISASRSYFGYWSDISTPR